MRNTALYIVMFIVGVASCPEHALGNSGWTINSITKSARLCEYLGLSVTHSPSDIGIEFVIECRSTRGIIWDPSLVTIADDKTGVLISEGIENGGGVQYSFTIAKTRLKNSVFYLHNYKDGVVYVEFDLAGIVESSKAKGKVDHRE